MADWAPPAEGGVCWIELTALDFARAKKFYSTVFNWTFKDIETKGDEMIAFNFPGESQQLSGGFRKVDSVHRTGAPRLYLYVNDLQKSMEMIIANGGKKIADVTPEGDFGLYMLAQDTEGNEVGIYTVKK